MSGAIRNWSVARGTLIGGPLTIVYTVPADHVLLLKQLSFRHVTPVDSQIFALLQASDAPGSSVIVYQNLAASAFLQWSGWIAANAGDQLMLQSASADVHYWASGALLPFIGPPQ